MQHTALFDGEDEDEAVDEAQQLLEVGVLAQVPIVQGSAQRVVGGVLQEAFAEGEQGLFHAVAQAVAHAGALGLASFAPALPNARAARLRRAAGVQQAPDVGELGITLAAQQVGQVAFEVGGAGEAGGVAQQAQLAAVADNAPDVVGAGVEQLLHGLEGRLFTAAAASHGKARVGFVQREGVGGHQHGHAGGGWPGHEADGVGEGPGLHRGRGLHGGVAQRIAQQFGHKALGEHVGVHVGALALRGKVLPLGAGDLEGAAVFVLELDAFGDAVVGVCLVLRAALGGFFELVGQEEAAFKLQGRQVEHGLLPVVADAFHVIWCPPQWLLWPPRPP